MDDLAAALEMSVSGLTRLAGRSVDQGLFHRVRSGRDAQGWNATLTDTGFARLEAAWPTNLASVRRHFLDHLARAAPSTRAAYPVRNVLLRLHGPVGRCGHAHAHISSTRTFVYTAAVILSVLLALVLLAAAAPKVQLKGDIPGGLVARELSAGLVRFIGVCELIAAVGLVAGIWWQPLGIAAATGVAVLLLGAIGHHLKWGDYRDSATRSAALSPVLFLCVAVAAAITLAASL
ncbi:DoxX family protein [Streptomyces sp. NPDC059866]|uniref:DoxX family protein n=1 Tax=Streptomyces sp. NPDC059866 TaxID=3346978 RepID=UPI00364EFA74